MQMTPPPGACPRPDRERYMSFAFSWGDVLLEVDGGGAIQFAEGACEVLLGSPASALCGTAFAALAGRTGADALAAVRRDGRAEGELRLQGRGRGPISMHLAGYCHDARGTAYLALRVSRRPAAEPAKVTSNGTDFARRSAALAADWADEGVEAAVSFVSAPQLAELKERLPPEKAALLSAKMEAAVARRAAGGAVLRLDEGAYALVHRTAADVGALAGEIGRIAQDFGPDGLEVQTATLADCDPSLMREEDVADGVLYAIGRFREAHAKGATLKDLSSRMTTLAGEAVNEVRRFKETCRAGNFEIVFQPVVELQTGTIHHYEALSRFPGRPDSVQRVIAFAESTGMVTEFDLAVARQALKALNGFPRNSERFRLAINVSGVSISRPEYTRALLQLLERNLWTRGKLMFEITESARMEDMAAAAAFIDVLRRWGYQVCLDDFGAGAASFRHLSMLHVDMVKIDGWAIRNAQRTNKGRAFLSALTGLCRRLGIKTAGEMIDSPEMLEFVRECGCDHVQGHLFGRPHRDLARFSPLPNANLARRPGGASPLATNSGRSGWCPGT
jgi:EAL domain-containing protein (putative c-di-GMP-specific phosphodiesterase class I)